VFRMLTRHAQQAKPVKRGLIASSSIAIFCRPDPMNSPSGQYQIAL
jgi:hypothetical protein